MKQINLKEKKTETEWQKAIDNFWIKAIPRWFEWLGWVLILGTFTFLAEETQNKTLKIVSIVSYFGVFFYLQSFFYTVNIYGFPHIKSEKAERFLSLIISAILSLALWFLLSNLVTEIQGKI